DSSPTASGSFSYTAAAGDGSYRFYTVAIDDRTSVVEGQRSPPGATTLVDTAKPTSAATSPQYSTSNAFTVSYTASDPGAYASGLDKVELWAKAPGDLGYTRVQTDSSPTASGSFSYTAAAGDGSYRFYTVAIDKATNNEGAPLSPPDTTTLVDTAKPTSAATSPQYSTSNAFTVSYTASDPGVNASGLDKVELWAKDRKSTRLNSSHVAMTYAVFCWN